MTVATHQTASTDTTAMGFFANLLGRENRSLPAAPAGVNLPYETLIVPGREAVARCLDLRRKKRRRYSPVILGNPNDLTALMEGFEAAGDPPQEMVARAEGIDLAELLQQRVRDGAARFRDVEKGRWSDHVTPSSELTGHADVLRGQPFWRVAICKVPTPDSWKVPAFLSFGGWNDCPAPEEHVAVLRDWKHRYDADLITLSNDVIECTVGRPPEDREQAMALAREQFVYCPDIVYQGTGTLAGLAAALREGTTWYFWWD